MTRYGDRTRDLAFLAWVKLQRCLLAGMATAGPCGGEVEADHAGDRALGQKAADETCIPLCTRHHRDRHDVQGFFRGKPKEELRAWRLAAIVSTQQRHARWLEVPF